MLLKTSNKIEFPDPKYYMIGLQVDQAELEQEQNFSDWEISQTATKETLKLSTNVRSLVNDDDESIENNWKNVSTNSYKTSLRKIEVNKE